MKNFNAIGALALLVSAVAIAQNQDGQALVVTASNASPNQLLVYDASANLLQTIATGGQGGVSGNAGGVAARHDRVAVVNFGSRTVSLFARSGNRIALSQLIPAASSPVSVAFGRDHLYILGTTAVESHRIFDSGVDTNPDGIVTLFKADGSAAQVGVLENQIIVTEKSNAIETVNLADDGAVSGAAAMIQNIPTNVNVPFGLVTRGQDAYVTIAHANEISLVRHDAVVTTTGSGTQQAPCWLALDGPFLYSANSPSKSVSKYAVYGRTIVQETAVAAQFNGSPTDISYRAGLIAVIDGAGSVSHVSIFHVDDDGNLTLSGVATIASPANGAAVVAEQE